MFSRFVPVAAGLTAAALVAGCAVGPDYERPAAPDAARYTREPLGAGTASAPKAFGEPQKFITDMQIPDQWWTVFHSRELSALIERSIKANPTLEQAIDALRVAEETTRAQEGKFFPLVQGNFTATRQQISSGTPGASVAPSGNLIYNLYTPQLQVSYTFDIWGLNRRTVESLQAQADSQHFLVEAAYLTLTSNVVIGAINEASLREQISTTIELINANTKMLGTLKEQFAQGYVTRIDVAAQEAQLAQIEATLPPLRKALLQQRDLLTALAGRFPSEEPPEQFTLAKFRLPRNLPVTLPSKLVEQRPDVRAAEELLHSAAAQVGIAMANTLPNITLSANPGYVGTQLPGLISPDNLFWTVGGSATQTIADAGTLMHLRRAAEDAYDGAAASYRGTVITAMQNVADALRAIQQDAHALKAAVDFERAAKISLDLVTQQFTSGYINILLLLNAQQTYLQARLAVVQAQAARLSDTAALYQALGGGWWNRPPDSPTAPVYVGSDKQPIGTFTAKTWFPLFPTFPPFSPASAPAAPAVPVADAPH